MRQVELASFASEGATACFASEALAGRALQFLRPFSERLRALINGNIRAGKPPESSLGSAEPSPGPHDDAAETTTQEPPWDLPHLHAASLESIEYLKLLVDYGVVPPPWVKDWTEQIGAAPSLAATIGFLRHQPESLIVLRWTLREVPLDARLLHAFFGDVLPLSHAVRMHYLRRLFRDLRVLWVINGLAFPSPELRRAEDDVLTLASTFRRILELDPSLAILAGAQDQDNAVLTKDDTTKDLKMVQEALREAADMAVWEEDSDSALLLLEEAKRFAERRIGSVADSAEKDWLRAQSLQAHRMSQEVKAAPKRYAAQKQAATWRAASPEGIGLLKRMIGTGQTVDVPGEAVDAFNVESADGKIEVSGMVVHPKNHGRAPWLYSIQVDVLQNMETSHRDGTVAVTGLPIALLNTATGKRQVRCLRHDESETDDVVLSTAFFADLSPGSYRVELFAPRNAMSPPETSPGGTSPSSTLSPWRGLWAIVRRLWQSAWFHGNTEPKEATLHRSA